jgi:hypothetical protein
LRPGHCGAGRAGWERSDGAPIRSPTLQDVPRARDEHVTWCSPDSWRWAPGTSPMSSDGARGGRWAQRASAGVSTSTLRMQSAALDSLRFRMSRIIEHKDLVIWRDARGKWQCRSTAAPTGAVYRSGARSSGTEAIRSRLWGRGRRRRDVDEPPITVGNCGRPADKECGMLNPQECATHRQEDIDGRRLHMRIVTRQA